MAQSLLDGRENALPDRQSAFPELLTTVLVRLVLGQTLAWGLCL